MYYRICKECGTTYEGDEVEAFFVHHIRPNGHVYIHGRCRGCEQDESDKRKRARRSLKKAETAIRTHCHRYNARNGTSLEPKEFALKFGWDKYRMAHEIEHVHANGCPVCGDSFAEMGHGLRDVTIDIIDPTSPPVYGVNTRWICHTCNIEKQCTPMHLLTAKKQAWRKWRRQQELLQEDSGFGTLFEGAGVSFSAEIKPLIEMP